MNILLLTTISGFAPKFLMRDIHILQELGFTVHYASNFNVPIYECDREELESKGIRCHHIDINKSPFAISDHLKALKQLNTILETENIVAIHSNNPVGGVIGRIAHRKKRKLYNIYTAHGFHFYKGASLVNWIIFYPIERFLAKRTNQLITINKEDYEVATQFHLRKNGKVSQIPSVGLDLKRFYSDTEKRRTVREELKIDEKDFIFLAVGELNQNKNHKTIIEAFSMIKEPQTKLFICGEGNSREELESLIAKKKLKDKVVLWGYQNEIEKFYQCADCFLFPSFREGMGMAALEAMACGLPIIVGDNRGTREYARDNAIVCAANDVKSFEIAMNCLLYDKKQMLEMGKKSLQIVQEFTCDKTVAVMKKVYERMYGELHEKEQ